MTQLAACPECDSRIRGEHRPECRTGATEELAALRVFFAAMQTYADPVSGRYEGSQVGQAFREAGERSRLLRRGGRTAYHPVSHPFTVHGARAWHAGSAALSSGAEGGES